jgi:C-terminal processing protease CtpA/Prc
MVNVKTHKVGHSVIIATGAVTLVGPTSKTNVILEHTPNSLSFVTLFDLRDVGLEIASKDGVTVTRVNESGPLARAGVKTGDRIRSIDDHEVTSRDIVRTLLRASIASDGDTIIHVVRGNKDVLISHRFRFWSSLE